ncbi:MAG: ABA4-like family protein [Bacteroidota bacterium]
MTPSEVFQIVGLLAMPMWVLLIFLPKWKVTRFLIDYKVIPIILSVIYAIYIAIALIDGGMMDFGSLKSVMQLFTVENAVLAGWIHYLAFDLLIGMWIVNQNQTLKIHPIIIAPCLLGTFMLGPVGFLVFMIIRAVKLKKATS